MHTKNELPEDAALSLLATSLSTSIAALRATLESAAGESMAPERRTASLHGAIDEMARLARRVQALVDLARPADIAPLPCSHRELVGSALAALDGRYRSRVRVARGAADDRLLVDGPLFSRCLCYLLEEALEKGRGEVLLHVREEADNVVFAVVGAAEGEFQISRGGRQDREAAEETRRAAKCLARRDIERMGGRLEQRATPDGKTFARVVLPRVRSGGLT
jgi:K+-sensing histidine kinase KdpD